MYLWTDKFSGDEMFSDGFPVKKSEYILQVTSEMVEVEDEASGTMVRKNNLVNAFNYVESQLTKKGYKAHFKTYIQRIQKKLPSDWDEAKVKDWQKTVMEWYKKITSEDNVDLYIGESMDEEGCVAVCLWMGDDGSVPTFIFFRQGFDEEKV